MEQCQWEWHLAKEGERLPAWRWLQVTWVAIIGFESVWGLLSYLQYVVLLCVAFFFAYFFVTSTGLSQSRFVRMFLAYVFVACHSWNCTHLLKVWIWACDGMCIKKDDREKICSINLSNWIWYAFSIKANNIGPEGPEGLDKSPPSIKGL